MTHAHSVPLSTLYARLDAMDCERDVVGDAWSAHAAVLDRLAVNRQQAEANGWTSCAIERGGSGHFRMFGLPPRSRSRTEVPDAAPPSGDEH